MDTYKKITLAAIVGLIIVGLGFLLRQDSNQPNVNGPIKIGVITALTGQGAERGESTRQGLILALEKLKKESRFAGREFELIYQDAPADQPKRGVTAFNELIGVEKVTAVIGPIGSNVALAVTPLVDKEMIPVIIHTASALEATKDNEYVFRLWPTAKSYADAITEHIQKVGYQEVAAFTANSNNTLDFMEVLKSNLGDVIVSDEEIALEQNDFRTELTKLKATDVDAVFLNLYEGQIGQAAKQVTELGLELPLFTNSVMSVVELRICAECLESSWFPRFTGYTSVAEEEFIKYFGQEPATPETAAAAHDALLVLAEAIGQVGTDGEKIKDYIYAKDSFSGVIGEFRFLPSGDAEVPLSIKTVKNGEIVELVEE